MTPEEIQECIIRHERQNKEFKEELFRISWYMRGGVNVTDLFYLFGYEEREIMSNIIKDNLEMTKNSQMPLL